MIDKPSLNIQGGRPVEAKRTINKNFFYKKNDVSNRITVYYFENKKIFFNRNLQFILIILFSSFWRSKDNNYKFKKEKVFPFSLLKSTEISIFF